MLFTKETQFFFSTPPTHVCLCTCVHARTCITPTTLTQRDTQAQKSKDFRFSCLIETLSRATVDLSGLVQATDVAVFLNTILSSASVYNDRVMLREEMVEANMLSVVEDVRVWLTAVPVSERFRVVFNSMNYFVWVISKSTAIYFVREGTAVFFLTVRTASFFFFQCVILALSFFVYRCRDKNNVGAKLRQRSYLKLPKRSRRMKNDLLQVSIDVTHIGKGTACTRYSSFATRQCQVCVFQEESRKSTPYPTRTCYYFCSLNPSVKQRFLVRKGERRPMALSGPSSRPFRDRLA